MFNSDALMQGADEDDNSNIIAQRRETLSLQFRV